MDERLRSGIRLATRVDPPRRIQQTQQIQTVLVFKQSRNLYLFIKAKLLKSTHKPACTQFYVKWQLITCSNINTESYDKNGGLYRE